MGAVLAFLAMLALGLTAGVLVAGAASTPSSSTTAKTTTAAAAKTSKKKTTKQTSTKTSKKKRPTTKKKTSTTKKKTSTTASGAATPTSTTPDAGPGSNFFVLNGTAASATDHEIVGSSAFPNFTTGAVDNYYALAYSHVDNSPFAEGRASPADTGPIGQTAAAGNFQQPQYADARWPGDTGKATYGTQGQPYAEAEASRYKATADSSEASSGASAPGASGSTRLAVPRGFDGRLRRALDAWKAKWVHRLEPKTPKLPELPNPPKPTVATPTVTAQTPVGTITTPSVTLSTPLPNVAVPTVTVAGLTVPAATVPAPTAPTAPSALAPHSAAPSRSLSSASGDGLSLLESTSLATLSPKGDALVTSGESRLGRISIGGGQIVVDGIHVTASLTNDGTTPTDKIDVTVGATTIGGVPVTIDQDGVHVGGQGQGLPFQQASDALNGALKQAGIQLFVVAPEITKPSAGSTGLSSGDCSTGSGWGTTGTTTTSGTTTSRTTTTSPLGGPGTTTTSTDQGAGMGDCSTGSSGGDTGTGTCTTGSGTGMYGGTGTTDTTSTSGTGTGSTTTTPSPFGGTGTTTTTGSSGDMGSFGGGNQNEETITATGLHVVFTQPVDQSGVPAQHVEHILGEVFLDSLAEPAGAAGAAGPLSNLSFGSSNDTSSSTGTGTNASSTLTPCGPRGKHTHGMKKLAASLAGGTGSSAGGTGSSAGGSSSSGSPAGSSAASLSPSSGSASGAGSSQPGASLSGGASQPASSSSGGVPQAISAAVSSVLKKPVWLLLAYLLWQALVIATGVSLWKSRRGGAS